LPVPEIVDSLNALTPMLRGLATSLTDAARYNQIAAALTRYKRVLQRGGNTFGDCSIAAMVSHNRRRPPQVGTFSSIIAAGLHMTIYCDVSSYKQRFVHSKSLQIEYNQHEHSRFHVGT
jgi:hypothetical protein